MSQQQLVPRPPWPGYPISPRKLVWRKPWLWAILAASAVISTIFFFAVGGSATGANAPSPTPTSSRTSAPSASDSPSPRRVAVPRIAVPDVTGKTAGEARSALEQAGFTVEFRSAGESATPPDSWTVTTQIPLGGATAKIGAIVWLTAIDPVPPPAPEPAAPAPAPEPVAPAPAAPAAPPSVYYKNCDAVRAAGKAPLYEGEPGYASHLDRDHDGIACE